MVGDRSNEGMLHLNQPNVPPSVVQVLILPSMPAIACRLMAETHYISVF